MFDERVIAARQDVLERRYRSQLPKTGLVRHPIPYIEEWQARLTRLRDDKGNYTRKLTADEELFIRNEWILSKIDVPYFLERYVYINVGGSGLARLYPLWESQRIILKKMGDIEYRYFREGQREGVLVNILKARQYGASTLAQSIIAHRMMFYTHVFGLVASDVPESSAFLFDMFERIVNGLPWYLKPNVIEHVKNAEMLLDNDSHIWVGSGRSTRGVEGKRGQLGRTKTISALHLSELSTWEDAAQVNGSLLPAVPYSGRVIWINESTAKGRHNEWHKHWLSTEAGHGRFHNIFIPWYVEEKKYSRPAPASWAPSDSTLSHAAQCEEDAPRFMGHRITLTRDQLFWYERERALYEDRDELATFMEEYAADPETCFQFSGKGVFSLKVQQRIRDALHPPITVMEVTSRARMVDPYYAERGAAVDADNDIQRSGSPVSGPRPLVAAQNVVEVPSGYGLRPLTRNERDNLESYRDHVSLWELPRKDQDYILSVDVSDGIGQDNSVIDITRVGTIREPDEQVAQFITNIIDPIELAYIIDVMGHLYADGDGFEAIAAVETNSHGIATHSELERHCGYSHFFVRQEEDAAPGTNRYLRKVGWLTTSRTRPLIVARLVKAVKTVDPITHLPDYIINSPFTLAEMADFRIPPDGSIGDATAASGAHDDALIAAAIGVHIAQTLHFEQREPLADTRRRLILERARSSEEARRHEHQRDYINCDATVDEVSHGYDGWDGSDTTA